MNKERNTTKLKNLVLKKYGKNITEKESKALLKKLISLYYLIS